MIHLENFNVNKNGRTICSVPSLTIESGDRAVILGSNGSGKTTLLRVLAGLEPDYSGRCDVEAPRIDRVYVHQSPYLLRGSVLKNVTYGLRARGIGRHEREQLAMHWLKRLGVGQLAAERVAHLSGGEKRRVALARAMVLKPRLLLLDEPLADLDESGTAMLTDALRELDQSTILIASPSELFPDLTARTYRLDALVEPSAK
jgi:ABC-type nitrate/sulfonate/bicarbonate transport system ATPase subunit